MNILEYMRYMDKIQVFVNKMYNNSKKDKNSFILIAEQDWSFVGKDSIRVKGKDYKLSKILGTTSISVEDLENMTNRVLHTLAMKKGFDINNVSKIKVSCTSIQIYFIGEDENDCFGGKFFSLNDIYDIFNSKNSAKPENPFKYYDTSKHRKFMLNNVGLELHPSVVNLSLDSILDELKFQGFKLLLKQEIQSTYNNEYYYFFVHKTGVLVTLKGNNSDIYGGGVQGTIFIFCKENSKVLSALDGWSGGGKNYTKSIYSGFTNELRKAYDISDTEWVCGFPDKDCYFTFCVYSGSTDLKYLGGKIREERGGKNRFIVDNDVYSSTQLSNFCDYYENKIILSRIPKNSLKIPKNLINDCLNESIKTFKKHYPNELYLLKECMSRIDKAYGNCK